MTGKTPPYSRAGARQIQTLPKQNSGALPPKNIGQRYPANRAEKSRRTTLIA